ncbi:MAG: hypothetical protein DLM55_00075 [Acidimicrobiales bacterium]|nr:MAG: hypothetical protein DLM55_00075 [Acidimicrobiales bacterium]
MPSGVPSAVLFAILIGVALLALVPALISRGDSVTVAQQELDASSMRVLDRGNGSTVTAEPVPDDAGKASEVDVVARQDSPPENQSQRKRALEFVEKLARTTTIDAVVQREVVAWLAAPAQRRGAPSDRVRWLLAAGDKEPFQRAEAWLVRSIVRPRPRLVAPIDMPSSPQAFPSTSNAPHRRAA